MITRPVPCPPEEIEESETRQRALPLDRLAIPGSLYFISRWCSSARAFSLEGLLTLAGSLYR